MAADAVFTVMATGQEAKGREAITQLLDYFYHQAFDATAEERNLVIGDGQAVLEADFTGTHIGEFAEVAASGKKAHVPLCVAYELQGDQITKARIYFETDAFRQQVGT
ncbi:MAG: ester cyclase [Candidatus Dormibacteraceae bacterium]